MRLILAILGMVLSCNLSADDVDTQQIIQRIKPVGKVRIQEEMNNVTSAQQQTKSDQTVTEVKKMSGKDTFERYCIVCHKDGLAGAPKFQNTADWAPRLKGRTIEDLVASSEKGLNAMPAKGTCNECSDDDLKAAIQYMLPKS
ncbi:c-type cytochrome [Legionella waltersii]|uniref:Cytochrome c5 n=1 Tax=Legionella waltersii TaxID=66969 RepID=A0A0W1ADJ1_9GAMM|nr:c-type cytochrome [Legionella waltersii]KTD79332.1 cytochrome c5 [Legionella waltersii]SNV13098.1 cytochrome c5 [Legionella waltersii]